MKLTEAGTEWTELDRPAFARVRLRDKLATN